MAQKSKKVQCNCDFCGKEIIKLFQEMKRNKHHFCDSTCSYLYKTGANNPAYSKAEVTCNTCGKSIERTPFQVTHYKTHYCSRECMYEHLQKENKIIECKECGVLVEVHNSKFEKFNNLFCSKECKFKWHSKMMSGSNNPSWMGGISFKPYTPEWTHKLRVNVRERDSYTCQECGTSATIVHHIDYNKENSCMENLITLCTSCHGKTCFNREYFTNRYKESVLCLTQCYLMA